MERRDPDGLAGPKTTKPNLSGLQVFIGRFEASVYLLPPGPKVDRFHGELLWQSSTEKEGAAFLV